MAFVSSLQVFYEMCFCTKFFKGTMRRYGSRAISMISLAVKS